MYSIGNSLYIYNLNRFSNTTVCHICSSPFISSAGRLPDSSAAATAAARLNALSLGLRKASLCVENQQSASSFFRSNRQPFKSDFLVRSASAAVVVSTSPSVGHPISCSLSVDSPCISSAAANSAGCAAESAFPGGFQVRLLVDLWANFRRDPDEDPSYKL